MLLKLHSKLLVQSLAVVLMAGWVLTLVSGSSSFTFLIEALLLGQLALIYRPKKGELIASIILLAYLGVELWIALERDEGFYWLDFIRATKPWIYLSMFVGATRVDGKINLAYVRLILALFLLGYFLSLVQGAPRPYLIVENNFEIPFVVSLWSICVVTGRFRLWAAESLVVACIVGLSLSRSGAAIFASVFMMLAFRQRGGLSFRRALRFGWVVPVLGGALAWVFIQRTSDILAIDRLAFFKSFVSAYSSVGLVRVLFGSGALATVPNHLCMDLSYYLEALSGEYGQCYAVVWHASFFRLLFDFGLIGFFGVYLIAFNKLRQKFSRIDSVIGLTPAFLAGFSVGGIYNFFSFLGVLVFFVFAMCPDGRRGVP